MRPLPKGKQHGIVDTVHIKKEHLDKLANDLGIGADRKQWFKEGNYHIVREAQPHEMTKKST